MSVVAQRKITRGPAKIIPFPTLRSTVQVKQPHMAHWIYWIVLLVLAAIGGEIWSAHLRATTIRPATMERESDVVTVKTAALALAPSRVSRPVQR
jgi:hypothetical protein